MYFPFSSTQIQSKCTVLMCLLDCCLGFFFVGIDGTGTIDIVWEEVIGVVREDGVKKEEGVGFVEEEAGWLVLVCPYLFFSGLYGLTALDSLQY